MIAASIILQLPATIPEQTLTSMVQPAALTSDVALLLGTAFANNTGKIAMQALHCNGDKYMVVDSKSIYGLFD